MSDVADEVKVAPEEAAARLTDFSDWLSPMLVKELRQGLRTKVFVLAFIILQGVLSMMLFFSLGGNSGSTGYVFWLLSAVLIVGAMPLRGFAALSDEIDDHTLDLLMVTRLSALRIAFGKWSALVVQTLLLCVTILPYVFMRYFLGGIDLRAELSVFYYLFLLSSVLTALTVAFSVFTSFLVRSAVIMLAGWLCVQVIGSLLTLQEIPRDWLSNQSLLMIGLSSAYACWFLLEFGASRIASAAENHAIRKRLVSIVVVGVVAAMSIPAWRGLLLVLALVPAIDALAETNNPNRSILRPFVAKGIIGRLAGRLLYPGWSSGVWFTLLLASIAVGADVIQQHRLLGSNVPVETMVQWLAWPAAVLAPIPVLWFLLRRKPAENRFGLYMVVQSAMISTCLGILLVAAATKQQFLAIAAFVFPHGLLATFENQNAVFFDEMPPQVFFTISGLSAGGILVASLIASWYGFRSIRVAERESAEVS